MTVGEYTNSERRLRESRVEIFGSIFVERYSMHPLHAKEKSHRLVLGILLLGRRRVREWKTGIDCPQLMPIFCKDWVVPVEIVDRRNDE